MTQSEARALVREHNTRLDKALEDATSQFQIRMCYVNAHEELVEIAQNIIKKLVVEDDHK